MKRKDGSRSVTSHGNGATEKRGHRFAYPCNFTHVSRTGISGVHEKYPIDSKVVGRVGYATGVRKAGNANLSLRDGR
ncbi:hypothetical protein BHE74_00057517 [Ensete ventricosum]|nr:hypothetical protein BHE74_00057517 [Ensete ventricosum]RZS27352.1 hypothetical protein BHM03_00060801 [Ensete ventricosum]